METYFGLPEKVEFCARCVISNQRPSSTVEFKSSPQETKQTIEIDDQGVCSACRFQDEKSEGIDWEQREKNLIALCDKHRKSNGDYDVIVPGSGGKDSAFTSHILKYKYGMNPLTVTWAPHKYTDIGWKNFENWIHVGGLDNVLFTPSGRLHQVLTRYAFMNLLHPFQPFIVGQRKIGPEFAMRYGISLIMYGENQAEYGNNVDENATPIMKSDFFSASGFDDLKLGGESVKDIMTQDDFSLGEFRPYLPLNPDQIREHELEVHYLGYYLKWDPQECYYYAVEHTGFEANPERTEGSYSKYSSIDDRVDPFHYYTTLVKFGLGRASYDAAQEIRNQKITREEGVQLVKKFDQEFPTKYFTEFLDYIGISEEAFHTTCDKFRSPHLWRQTNQGWELRRTIWDDGG